jgi:hypothetical protein
MQQTFMKNQNNNIALQSKDRKVTLKDYMSIFSIGEKTAIKYRKMDAETLNIKPNRMMVSHFIFLFTGYILDAAGNIVYNKRSQQMTDVSIYNQ